MKINQEYIKGLLEVFESADTPTVDIQNLKDHGFDYNENDFIFHLQILADQNLVKPEQGHSLGYEKGADGGVVWSIIPLRLTAQGHEFLEALRNAHVWETLKSEFKDASISTIVRVSKELLENYTKQKITSLLGSGE